MPLGFFLTGAAFCMATLHVPRKLGPTPPNDRAETAFRDHGIVDSPPAVSDSQAMFLRAVVLLLTVGARGASEGQFVTYGLLEKYDVIAWANWMKGTGCHSLYGLGESLGASILIQAAMAVKPAFAAIVAESPYADLRETAEYRVRQMSRMPGFVAKMVVISAVFYARWVDNLDLRQVSPVRAIVLESTPILLIHGLQDFRTPASNSQDLLRAESTRIRFGSCPMPDTQERPLWRPKSSTGACWAGFKTTCKLEASCHIQEYHDRITHLHIKDRKKNDGPNMPWGEGDTPIKQVLLLLKDKKYPLPALVEYEYRGTGTPAEEVQKCLDYMRHSLS